MIIENIKNRINKRALLTGLLVAVPFAGWAFFVNYEHGTPEALKAGGVQYIASSTLSFIMYSLVDAMRNIRAHKIIRMIIMTLIPSYSVILLMIIGHWLASTPDILESVALSATISPFACFFYALSFKAVD